MKLHAKWSTLSFLGAIAFGMGAAVYTGCTVTTGEVDDFDGGSGTNLDSGTTNNGDAGTTGDGGGGTVGTVCRSAQKAQIVDDACQLCLEQKCCSQLQGCFDLPASDGVSCDEYGACVDQFECDLDTGADAGSTLCDGCRSSAATGVPAGYQKIFECGVTNCATECKVQ